MRLAVFALLAFIVASGALDESPPDAQADHRIFSGERVRPADLAFFVLNITGNEKCFSVDDYDISRPCPWEQLGGSIVDNHHIWTVTYCLRNILSRWARVVRGNPNGMISISVHKFSAYAGCNSSKKEPL